jgi:hypothetical protein
MDDIKRTLWGAFGYMYEFRVALVKALLLPFGLLMLLGYFVDPEMEPGFLALLSLLHFVIYAVIVVTTHRIVLLGPESVSEWGLVVPQKRELYFLLYTLGLAICMIPVGLFALILPGIGIVVSVVVMFYLIARLSLVFPSVATDQGWSFSDSWKATQSHQPLMIVVVVIIPFLIAIPEQLLSFIPYTDFLVVLLSLFSTVYIVAALSVAFQVVTEKGEGG